MDRKTRLVLALIFAAVLLLDNVTTILAINNGAEEVNPLIKPFLSSEATFTLFTILKVLAGFAAVYFTASKSMMWFLFYLFTLYIFTRAVVVNFINAF